MPRQDESIQKRLNAYNVAKELMQIEELGAIIFVNNEAYSDLKKINTILVNMLDAFLSDTSYSSGSNFDDSEKMKMLKDNGAFVIAMLSDKNSENNKVTTSDMVKALTVIHPDPDEPPPEAITILIFFSISLSFFNICLLRFNAS